MEQNQQIEQTKPKKNNLALILTLAFLLVIIIVLIIVIIVINNQPSETADTGESPVEAELEEAVDDATEIPKETSSLDCTREMTAEELASFNGVSGQVEIVADFNADNSLANIALYKTIIGPSTDAENPSATGDEFLVENATATADELNSTNLPTYYLTEGNTEKQKANSSWTSQGFTCLDQSEE